MDMLLKVLLIILVTCQTSNTIKYISFNDTPQGKSLNSYKQHQGKIRAFVTCRKECIHRCDFQVYRLDNNSVYCHDCLRECMYAFLDQALHLGVDFDRSKPTKRSYRRFKKL